MQQAQARLYAFRFALFVTFIVISSNLNIGCSNEQTELAEQDREFVEIQAVKRLSFSDDVLATLLEQIQTSQATVQKIFSVLEGKTDKNSCLFMQTYTGQTLATGKYLCKYSTPADNKVDSIDFQLTGEEIWTRTNGVAIEPTVEKPISVHADLELRRSYNREGLSSSTLNIKRQISIYKIVLPTEKLQGQIQWQFKVAIESVPTKANAPSKENTTNENAKDTKKKIKRSTYWQASGAVTSILKSNTGQPILFSGLSDISAQLSFKLADLSNGFKPPIVYRDGVLQLSSTIDKPILVDSCGFPQGTMQWQLKDLSGDSKGEKTIDKQQFISTRPELEACLPAPGLNY